MTIPAPSPRIPEPPTLPPDVTPKLPLPPDINPTMPTPQRDPVPPLAPPSIIAEDDPEIE